jgi:hypothetical protein
MNLAWMEVTAFVHNICAFSLVGLCAQLRLVLANVLKHFTVALVNPSHEDLGISGLTIHPEGPMMMRVLKRG